MADPVASAFLLPVLSLVDHISYNKRRPLLSLTHSRREGIAALGPAPRPFTFHFPAHDPAAFPSSPWCRLA
jgi:hypothetical protein